MSIFSKLVAAFLLLTSPAFADGSGIFNPSSNNVGDFQGIDSNLGKTTPTLTCSYTPVTTGTQGVAYTGATPTPGGGVGSYTFSETGSLPSGLTISTSTGVISGTPTANGSFTGIQVKVTDSASTVTSCGAAFTLVIAAPAFALVFNESANNTAGGTIVDYSTLNYTAGATRVIVASIWFPGATTTITGITVGGVALAQVSGAFATTGAAGISADVWESTGPLSGSSGDIVVTYGGALAFHSTIAVYSLTTTTPTAAHATPLNNTGTNVISSSITVPSGGGAIVLSANNVGAAATFTGAAIDATADSNQYYGHTTATGSVTVTGTYGASSTLVQSLVSWGP